MSAGAIVSVRALAMVLGGSIITAVTGNYGWLGMTAAAAIGIVAVSLFVE